MMNKKRVIALILVLASAMTMILASCNNDDNQSSSESSVINSSEEGSSDPSSSEESEDPSSEDPSSEEETSGEEDSEPAANTMAKITSITENEYSAVLYSGDEISDFASVDTTAFTETTDTVSLTIPSETSVLLMVDGELTEGSLSDIEVNDMVVFSEDAEGNILQIVVY